jgi:hypothetical protein
MAIKYSVLYPYYKRSGHLHNTLISFLHHYSDRDDYEIVIAEDFKNMMNNHEHAELLKIIERFKDHICIIHINIPVETWNPCIAFNCAAEAASGDFYLVTNPECFHLANVLEGLDEEFEKDPAVYVVCGCRNRIGCKFFIESFDELGGVDGVWFSHSEYKKGCLHFCNAMSKRSWEKVGGFDEDYRDGIAYDDNDFINRVRRAQLKIVRRDDLLTIHIDHGAARIDPVKRKKLAEVNWKVYSKKWD